MDDRYHIDLSQHTLDAFREMIQSRELVPSRKGLKEDIEKHFESLKNGGMATAKDLVDALKTKPKIAAVSKETGVPADYLTVLSREARSYLPSPVRLDRFAGISASHTEALAKAGITHSRHLFRAAAEKNERQQLARKTGIARQNLDELVGLSDLSRVYGVGPTFARILYDAGVTSLRLLRDCTVDEVVGTYEDATQKRADFGAGEMSFCLQMARALDVVVDV